MSYLHSLLLRMRGLHKEEKEIEKAEDSIQEDKTGGLLPAPLPLPSLQPGLQLIQPVLQLLVPPGQLLNLLDRLSQ